jgi:PhzF family phenazine biosynthesis protein
MRRPFHQVDVFTDEPLRGNPVAVVLDGSGIDATTMQAVAAWTNLSETTFLLPPDDARADYRVRIFTPDGELPFAGHPTLGSAHAWLTAGGTARGVEVVQECGVGLIRIRRTDGRLAFAAPPSRREEVAPAELDAVLAAVRLNAGDVVRSQALDNGPRWVALLLADAAAVLALQPDQDALRRLPLVGVVGRHDDGSEVALEVRGFAGSVGIPEDPVTGSLNASVAQWLIGEGVLPERYLAAQGTCIGRAGRVHVEAADGEVWVGGGTSSLIVGELDL